MSAGRVGILSRRASAWLGTIDAGTGVPRYAAVAIGLAAVVCCALETHAPLLFGAGVSTFALGLASCIGVALLWYRIAIKPCGGRPRLD
jgi:hypothetical protein